MLKKEDLDSAIALERALYSGLIETEELTNELLDAVGRGDATSVRLFLNMRKEPILAIAESRQALEQIWERLPGDDGLRLRALLNGEEPPVGQQEQVLVYQATKNRNLLERILQKDQAASIRMGRERSFYLDGKESR